MSKVVVQQAVLRGLETGGRAGGGRDEGVEVPFGRNGDGEDQEWQRQREECVRCVGGKAREARLTVFGHRVSWCERKGCRG